MGFPLAGVLAAIGMAIASALAVFFGVAALPNILTMLMVGAGVGAGIGAGLTCLRVDSIPAWPILLGAGLALSARKLWRSLGRFSNRRLHNRH